ncbi:MAG TPA: hypothetical protein VFW11_12840 [Cyclobacteriaceae bacterium]|nr:hypothetical protein [Cyclobacteriaceae bacterium]
MRRLSWILFLLIVSGIACEPDRSDDPIPYTPFADIVINLNLPQYNALFVDGGFVTIGGGVRGIIIYRLNPSSYLAFERNCSFHPNDACATVDIDISGFYMIDPCCGSTFSLTTGMPIGGIAWRPLRQYKTSLSFSELTITDEVL